MKKVLAAAFYISFFGCIAFASQKEELHFLPQVYVDSDQISLGDLVSPQDVQPSLLNELQKILIAQTPRNGEMSKFSNFAISEILRYHFKNQANRFNIFIPSEIKVLRKNNKITSKEITEKIVEWVKPTCEPCQIEVSSLQIQNAGEIGPKLTWKLSTTQSIPRGIFNLGVDLYRDENFIKKVFVQGVVKIYQNVPVAMRVLPIGTRIQREDFSIQKQDVTFSRELAPQEKELLGSETSQYVLTNQPLWRSSLKRRLALTRGAPVSVQLGDAGWMIRFTGVAQDNGYVGDVAKILNPATKKIITGLIIDENTVEVQ